MLEGFPKKQQENKDKKNLMSRRNFLRAATTVGAGVALFGTRALFTKEKEDRLEITPLEYKKLKPNLEYVEKYKPNFRHLHLLGKIVEKVGIIGIPGRISETLKYKNITDAVEQKYNLPENALLAMIMRESTGLDLQPNARGDGGYGLIHMQAATAQEFGLKTYENCNSLVCNGTDHRSCRDKHGKLKNHATELLKFIKHHKHDRKKLINADERLNPLLNVDAAGRMLAFHLSQSHIPHTIAKLDRFKSALALYAGVGTEEQYTDYIDGILENMRLLNDEKIIARVGEEFNEKNKHLTIDGEKGDFDDYISASQKMNENYGLEEYKKLPLYQPKHSDDMKDKYSFG